MFDAFNDDTAALNILKLFAIEETVDTREGVERYPSVPKPTTVLVNVALDTYPSVASPVSDEKRDADEINVDGTDERYPMEPKPTKELVS